MEFDPRVYLPIQVWMVMLYENCNRNYISFWCTYSNYPPTVNDFLFIINLYYGHNLCEDELRENRLFQKKNFLML